MNDPVIIKGLGVNEVLEIVHELKKVHGLKLNEDFEYYYHPNEFDFMNPSNSIERHTKFVFKDNKWAVFFLLKYGSRQ